MKKFFIVLCIIIFVVTGVVIANSINNNIIQTTGYVVVSDKIPESFNNYKIAFLSDFHNSEYYEKVAQSVKEIKPDIIIFGGDMITVNKDDFDNTIALINEIVNVAPIYMATGNHEVYTNDWKTVKRPMMEELGVNVIDLNNVVIKKKNDQINIYGLIDPGLGDSVINTDAGLTKWLNRAKDARKDDMFNILISHRANYFERTSLLGYDLVLSGHLHGGVIRLPIVGGVFSPDRTQNFPEYSMGRYQKDDSLMIVSRGLDKDKEKVRVFNGPEVVQITLRSSNK